MKIKNILEILENQGNWVNRSNTKDRLLIGNIEDDVSKVFICWVATNEIIKKAIEEDCHFIITHENPFYLFSTSLPTVIFESQNEKRKILEQNKIAVYRCHDLWDLYPEYGVRDRWAKVLQLQFEDKPGYSYIRIANNVNMKVDELAKYIAQHIKEFRQYGIQVIGDLSKTVDKLGIGTGALTDIFEMCEKGADACLVTDDGIKNWVEVQWAIDHNIPLFVVNHMTSEVAGMMGLCEYLENLISNVQFKYIENDYGIYYF